jgi:hypothetical protein
MGRPAEQGDVIGVVFDQQQGFFQPFHDSFSRPAKFDPAGRRNDYWV